MGKIRLLPDEVASQVAAGEVVERPASVVKELVENAVDAGARRITVEFVKSGAPMIRVTDDGCGMDREDALLCLERHATSKIRSAADLARVATMGFRGEAVPSIASVSRFRLVTRPHDEPAGTEIQIAGGKVESVTDSGAAPGTSVEVRSLFFNVPARRKFLRGDETEAAHIVHQVQSLALAHPDVAITLIRDGRCLWQAAATRDDAVRIRDVFGPDFLSRLRGLEPFENETVAIRGHLARPGEGRPDREQQFIILNGRVIQCPAIFQPLREAYAEALPRGRHPLAVLRIELDPLAFDCNVHPAKREIRLHRPDLVKQAVFQAAQDFLSGLRPDRPAVITTPAPMEAPRTTPEPERAPPRPSPVVEAFAPPPQRDFEPEPAAPVERFQLLGPLGDYWILMESSEGLVLLDVRAASERILFETLRREAADGAAASQRLLLPEVVELPPRDAVWVQGNLDGLLSAGFQVEPFGGSSFKIEALPACLAGRDARTALIDVCSHLEATGSLSAGTPAVDAIIRSVCRLAAIERFRYDESRARRLVQDLLACELPYACPQGRPTMIQWAFAELERKFGRG
ncbi:MAG: DNA mismatch repair endonuclease MutL [Terrimicrobiaceae bacterium]|nr:DNA mismatch repair endonuclease MutL [Terrimicrobiaceae bacterium]